MQSKFLLLVVLVGLSFVSISATKINPCPKFGSTTGEIVFCDDPKEDSDSCLGRCCIADGFCHSSSCVQVWRLKNSNCGDKKCLAQVQCKPKVTGCDASGLVHCLGSVTCTQNQCGGYHSGDRCLYDGNSKNFKVCPSIPYSENIQCVLCLQWAIVGVPFSTQITGLPSGATVGLANIPNNSLPDGLQLSSAGVIYGTPTTAGDNVFSVDVTANGVTTLYYLCPIRIRNLSLNCDTNTALVLALLGETDNP